MKTIAHHGAAAPGIAHMPQLDGLRAYAVTAVLVHHLIQTPILPAAFSVSWGLIGVRLFFVLSGFLITGLLLQARTEAERSGGASLGVIGRFYARRALRIFPLYYLVLFGAFLFGPPDAREQLPWLATYTYNFWVSYLGYYTAYFSHFWSLCVEEQFYLLWPWIIVFAPRRQLMRCAVVMVLAAPLYRALALLLQLKGVAFYTLTPSSFDALGLGALLAICTNGEIASAIVRKRLKPLPIIFVLGSPALFFVLPSAFLVMHETLLALAFLWLVGGASAGFTGVGRWLLQSKPLLYVGKISYGIYVYHLFMPDLINAGLRTIGVTPLDYDLFGFFIFSAATVGLASFSWVLFEGPINRLKARFSYVPKPQAAAVPLAGSRPAG